jgi:GNAT superfamily N-acetyltransferase
MPTIIVPESPDTADARALIAELDAYLIPLYPIRGLGLGTRMLKHLTAYALHHGVHVLRLETGIYQPEASRLYERYGFQRIPPFGDYAEGPFHLFYEKQIP